MPSERDRRIARVCLEKGYATPEQVGECFKAAASDVGRPFEDVLRRQGYISDQVHGELAGIEKDTAPVDDTLRRCRVCATVHGGELCPACVAGFATADSQPPTEDLDPEVQAATADPAKRIGKFVLLRELGAGGMGVVFKAWQTDLRRHVALKFIRGVESRQDRERFLREAQLAATLSHPGIAPIYESGSHDGKHYFAMQYVEGTTLDRFLRATPKPELRQAVDLLARVAEAVGYAHEHGIIHRDLKPANIMVDPRGRAYVMDFGLAKSVRAGSSLTGSGYAVGTPSYMSPEQARGKAQEIGPPSDVYALGAILYEVLAGRPPFVSEDVAQVLSDVAHLEPIPPRKLAPAVPGELETVALKALEKDPARRYASAEAFAADLRRWLAGEPVLARPAGAVTRFVRKLRKHKGATAGAAAVAAALLVALSAWTLRAREQRTRAEAKPYFEEAANLFESADKIRFMAKVPDDAFAQYRSQLQRAEANAMQAVDRDPRFADAHYLLGKIRRLLLKDSDAERDYGRAVENDPGHLRAYIERALLRVDLLASRHGFKTISRRTSTPQPQFTWHEDSPQAEARRADILADLEAAGRLAGRDFEKALLQGASELALWRPGPGDRLARSEEHLLRARALQPNDPAPLRLLGFARLLRSDHPGAAEFAAKAVDIAPNDHALLHHAAILFQLAGRAEESLGVVDRALRINPGSPALLNLRGNVRMSRQDFEGAYADYQDALRREPRDSAFLCNLGYLCYRMNRLEEAVDAYGRAIDADPSDPDGHEGRAVAYLGLGRFEEAERDMDRVIAARPTADSYSNRGAIRARAGRLDDAMADHAKALEIEPDNAGAHYNLGILRQRQGHHAAAVEAYRRSIELGRVQSDAYLGLARALIKQRNFAEAEQAASRAVELAPDDGAAYADRGQSRVEQGNLEAGLADYLVALEKKPGDASLLRDVGLIHLKSGRPAEAVPFLERAQAAGKADASPLLGDALHRLGRLEEAEAAFTRGVEALPKDPLPFFGRARVRQALGRREDAIADLDACIRLAPTLAPAFALRGMLQLEAGRKGEATADLERAIALDPRLAPGLDRYLHDARQ